MADVVSITNVRIIIIVIIRGCNAHILIQSTYFYFF